MTPDGGSSNPEKTAGGLRTRQVEFRPSAGKLPSPEDMAAYVAIDQKYSQQIMETFQLELNRNFRYQLFALAAGWTFALSLAVEAGVLTVQGHEKLALILIGANALGLATRMLTKAASRN